MRRAVNERFLRLAGLARRAGKLYAGFDEAERCARKSRGCLLVTSADISEKTLKEVRSLAERYSAKVVTVSFTKLQIGGALGAREVAVFAVSDKSFAGALEDAAGQLDGGAV